MDMINRTSRLRKGRRTLRRLAGLLLVLVGLSVLGYSVYDRLAGDNWTQEAPDWGGHAKPVFYEGRMIGESAVGTADGLKLPFDTIKQLADPNIRYEPSDHSVIITTKDKVIRMRADQLAAVVNDKPFELRFSVERKDGIVYVPAQPFMEWYGLDLQETARGAVLLRKPGDPLQYGTASRAKPEESTPLRRAPDRKSPILEELKNEERLYVWGEENGWYRVQSTLTGIVGYVDKRWVKLGERATVPNPKALPPKPAWKPVGEKLHVTWEHVVNRNPNPSAIGPMPGVHVVSPTWFHLLDGSGAMKNTADPAYVNWAHSRGYKVWALFSNSFDPDLTSEVLATYDKRMVMIRQLLAFAELYKLDGINIDFENVYLKDKDHFTQFVRELTPFLHEQGLVVSIDVTFKSSSETWSMFYDRKALAEVVDYMMIMAYDEHWASSPTAGSVGSLPWVERGLVQIMNEDKVPPRKILLGVPFYTRVWSETKQTDGKTKVESIAVTMEYVERTIREKKLTPMYKEDAGQHYVEYTEDGALKRIWIEDETSMRKRAELVRKYDLAGIASWRRGFEQPRIWTVIDEELKK